ncbi:MAG: response regulator [Candidatus Taylorbacteria bacterium]
MKKILIVEDDIFLGDVLLQKLKHGGYDAYLARDGALGFKQIKELKPDLVLLDLILPSMTGFEILEQKLKDPAISSIPVIVVSNSGQAVEIDRVLALGVEDYLIKAEFNPDEVLQKIKLQLGETGAPEREEKKSATSGPSSLKDKKIMWVEDDAFLSDIIARKLANQGCKLLHEINGELALKTAEREIPDIVLLDILLSGIDGYEILRRLKANDLVKHIPVIMLSNFGQQADIDKAKDMGAERFLIKATVTLDEIIEEIKNVLEGKKKA